MRGIQICHYLAKGLSIKDVANHLNLKREVVDARLKNLRKKHQCETTYQLMAVLGARGEFKIDNGLRSATRRSADDLGGAAPQV